MNLLLALLQRAPSVLVIIAALVQLLPAIAAFDARWLPRLYGIATVEESTTLLLRHRAVLLGLVGVALFVGALKPEQRMLAIMLGLASKLSFLLLTVGEQGLTPLIQRVARVDMVTASMLILAAIVHAFAVREGTP